MDFRNILFFMNLVIFYNINFYFQRITIFYEQILSKISTTWKKSLDFCIRFNKHIAKLCCIYISRKINRTLNIFNNFNLLTQWNVSYNRFFPSAPILIFHFLFRSTCVSNSICKIPGFAISINNCNLVSLFASQPHRI